jgi:hypothetical protein
LWKHVEGLNGLDSIACQAKLVEVAGQGRGHAGDVEEGVGFVGAQGVEEVGMEAGTGGIAEEGVGTLFFKEFRAEGFCFAFEELGVEVVEGGVFFGEGEGFRVGFDANGFDPGFGKEEGGNADAAVEVEDFSGSRRDCGKDGAVEVLTLFRVILHKSRRREVGLQVEDGGRAGEIAKVLFFTGGVHEDPLPGGIVEEGVVGDVEVFGKGGGEVESREEFVCAGFDEAKMAFFDAGVVEGFEEGFEGVKEGVVCGQEEGTLLDGNELAGIGADVAGDESFSGFTQCQPDVAAVVPLVGGGVEGEVGDVDFTDTLKGVDEEGAFGVKLGGVVEVLEVAAAAGAKGGTGRGRAVWRGVGNLEEFSVGKILFFGDQFHVDLVTFCGEGDEDDMTVMAEDAAAAEGDGVDGAVGINHGLS